MIVKVTTNDVGKRLDVFATQELPDLTRNYIQNLCRNGKIVINKKSVRPSHKLKMGEVINIDYRSKNSNIVPGKPIPILYEDNDCIVLIKPEGVLTHSKGAINSEATIASWLQSRITGLEGNRAGIVHRLDRATSGVMICAKTPQALKKLQKQFSERTVTKTYIAIVEGQLEPVEAILDLPIERNPKIPSTFRVGPNGKSAITQYKTLRSANDYSMIGLIPKTGRTHQLRVHLKYLKHPIVGDGFYGGVEADHFFLHALSLEIMLPNHQRKLFIAPLPYYFLDLMRDE